MAVIGAGVVGLAVGAALAQRGREVTVIEAEPLIGSVTSSRNSEVVHAGLYYPHGSLKARLCLEGNRLLYDWCDSHAVPVRKFGKLVVACDEDELAGLEALAVYAGANGVALERIGAARAREMEPALSCKGALFVPSSGMVDSHALMLSLRAEIEAHGGMVVVSSPVRGGGFDPEPQIALADAEGSVFSCKTLVNCAGLGAIELSRRLGLDASFLPRLHYGKGSYFSASGRPPFSRLIYPLPGKASAGLHYAFDWSNRARFGPDLDYVESPDYAVDPAHKPFFVAAIRRFWPELDEDRLQPDYAGIRPKLQGPGEPARDFEILTGREHGKAGYVALHGIDSPGLTASLALGRHVAELIAAL